MIYTLIVNQKGITPIGIFIILLTILIGGGFYYFVTNKVTNSDNLSNSTNNSVLKPTKLESISSSASLSPSDYTILNENKDSRIDITFSYPAQFYISDNLASDLEYLKKYPEYSAAYKNEVFSSQFSNRKSGEPIPTDLSPEESTKYMEDSMYINLRVNENPDKLSLKNYLSSTSQNLSVDGKTTAWQIIEPLLKPTNVPVEGSLEFVGTAGETPSKNVYFAYKDKVYHFSLTGGFGTGQNYSPAAEKVFDQIIQSIKLK